MTGIKNISNRVAARVERPVKGNGGKSKTTGVQRSVTHFEARAKQLAKKLVEAISRKGNDQLSKPTGVNRPTPLSADQSVFESCGPVARPAVFTNKTEAEILEIKGNGGAGRGTVTRASDSCAPGEQGPRTYSV